MNESIRIIGGQYRGKKLSFKPLDGLRPTPDRVRETLFNWLMHDIRDANCLDAFAGSGALGFEAFSRGAQPVTLIEYARSTYLNLQKQAAQFNTKNITIIQANLADYIQTTKQSFDIIFFDPPFSQPELYQLIEYFTDSVCLRPGGLLYVEAKTMMHLAPEKWETLKLKQAGNVVYGLYKKRAQ